MTRRALLYCAGGGIGDSLVASVVARALHQRYETVDALTLPAHRDTLERVPDIDGVLTDDGGDEALLVGAVAQRSYDAAVVTWATPRAARVVQRARIPVRVGQARRLYSYRFTERVLVRSETGDVASHWSDILLDYARAIGCDANDRNYAFVPAAGDELQAREVLAELRLPGEFVVLNPCNAIASKRDIWPTEGWAATGRALAERFGATVLVSGAPSDVPICNRIVSEMGDGAISIAGSLGIGPFGALVRQARAFVGITTGSMHVAAAVGAPTVGIFPFQSDYPDRWAPLGPRTRIVRPFYPCHRGDTKERCRDYACIANLSPAKIVAAVESFAPCA